MRTSIGRLVVAIVLGAPAALWADAFQVTSGVLSGHSNNSAFSMSLQLTFDAPDAGLSYSGIGYFPIGGVTVTPSADCGFLGCEPGMDLSLRTRWNTFGTDGGQLTVDGITYHVGVTDPYFPHVAMQFNGSWTVPELGAELTTSVTNPFAFDGLFDNGSADQRLLFGAGLATLDLVQYESRWRVTDATYTFTNEDPVTAQAQVAVPEPATLFLFGLGMLWCAWRLARQREPDHA